MNKSELLKCFMTTFGLSEDFATGDLAYNVTKGWDSIGHMALVANIEEEFNIMLDTDDIIDMSDYEKAVSILKKYGVKHDAS